MACGEHLDWGYVDQPPLIALVAWVVRHTLGTSLLAMRLPSALAGVALVLLAALLARELGGGRFAMALAAAGDRARRRLRRDELPVHDERVRAALLDWVRAGRGARRQDGRPAAVAGLRAGRGPRPAEQVLDGGVRRRARRRRRAEPAAPRAREALDLARRRARLAGVPAEPDLERAAPLALSRADAEHPRERPRRRAVARRLRAAPGAEHEPDEPARLARGPRLAALLEARAGLPAARHRLRLHARRLHRDEGQGLLPRACVRDTVRRRRCGDRGLRRRGEKGAAAARARRASSS